MGIGPFSHSSYDNKPNVPVVHVHNTVVCKPQPLPNPNPRNFVIRRSLQIGRNWLLVEVNYPDCTNYEGNKILLYRGIDRDVTLTALIAQGSLDPHFSNNPDFFSPFARFEPTDDGWNMAKELARWKVNGTVKR
jgi:hypothetical protein